MRDVRIRFAIFGVITLLIAAAVFLAAFYIANIFDLRMPSSARDIFSFGFWQLLISMIDAMLFIAAVAFGLFSLWSFWGLFFPRSAARFLRSPTSKFWD